MEIESWKDLMRKLPTMTEEQLRLAINYEVSRFRRKVIITRLHQRYCKLVAARERAALLDGTMLL